jgi:hypothetical protein
LALKVTESIIV